jgi:hypothetical protein
LLNSPLFGIAAGIAMKACGVFEREGPMTINPGEQPVVDPSGSAVTSRPLSPPEQRMLEDLRWGASAPEVQQHAGKVVAIRQRRVLAVGLDRQALRREASARAGCEEGEIVLLAVPAADLSEIPR